MGTDDGDDHDRSIFSHDLGYDLNSKLMLTAIVSLSAVILLVVSLHLYARCVLRRRGRGRAAAFRGFPAVISRFAASKRGLDRAVIASLPTFVVGARTDGREGATWTETECAVCLSGLEEQDTARVLPNCKHVFHVDCIDAWLESHATCPICRAEAEPRARLEPEPREGPVGVAPPSVPPLEEIRLGHTAEEAASSSAAAAGKMGGSVSRLDSFRRILTRERSSNRINPSRGDGEDRIEDLERR